MRTTLALLAWLVPTVIGAQERSWDPSSIKDCDRPCLIGMIDGLIHHVEVFPFVNLPYGLGNGWTPGSGH